MLCHFAAPLTKVDSLSLPFDMRSGHWMCFAKEMLRDMKEVEAWDVLVQ